MPNLSKFIPIVLSGLFLMIAASAKADTIEDLVFTGTAYCTGPSCSIFSSSPVTGTYSLDVDTQTIVGPWSFSTPLGVFSSSDAGLGEASVIPESGYYYVAFPQLPTLLDFQGIFLAFTDSDEIGPLDQPPLFHPGPSVCQANYNGSCTNDYSLYGSNSLVITPEPASFALTLIGVGLVGMMAVMRKRRVQGLAQAS